MDIITQVHINTAFKQGYRWIPVPNLMHSSAWLASQWPIVVTSDI